MKSLNNKSQLDQQFSSVQSLSHVPLFETPWTAACQASLSITDCQSLPKFMSIESVMPSNHLILYRPLLFLPSIFPNFRVVSDESALNYQEKVYILFSEYEITEHHSHYFQSPSRLCVLRRGKYILLTITMIGSFPPLNCIHHCEYEDNLS